MDATTMRRRAAFLELPRGLDAGAAATWLLGFVPVVYLGLEGGGYDQLVHDQVGIAVWWIVLAGVAVGALPRRRPGAAALAALGLLGALVAWTALSLAWSESDGRTALDLARVAVYLGVFALALLVCARGEAQRMVSAVAAAIVVVGGVALLSRLHPAWFPGAGETAIFIADSRERLSFPLNYWNGLGALLAIGAPLLLQVATGARTLLVRGLAAAALPALALTSFFTLSRGGIAAAALALAIYLVLVPDRLPRLLTAGVAAAGAAVLIAAAASRDALQQGYLGPLAREQGDEVLLLAIVACALVGLAQVGISAALAEQRRPGWTRVPRRPAAIATGVGVLVLVVAALAVDLPGRASGGWEEFREGGGPGTGTSRLNSVAGQSRYEFWSSAVDQNATKPLTGTGSGTFELWWSRNATTDESVRDTHSLYLQTLGELGLVGFALLLGLVGTIFFAGGWLALRAGPRAGPPLVAALAGCAAFFLTAAVDWMWQLPVLPVATLLLAAALLTGGRGERSGAAATSGAEEPSRAEPGIESGASSGAEESRGAAALPLAGRLGVAAAALLAIVAIAIPLAGSTLLRESEAEARAGDLDAALRAARTAQNVQPSAAAPRLQEALLLEEAGDLPGAAAAARAAVERERTGWRNWLVLARIEASRGNPAAAVASFERARSLNPLSPIFAE